MVARPRSPETTIPASTPPVDVVHRERPTALAAELINLPTRPPATGPAGRRESPVDGKVAGRDHAA